MSYLNALTDNKSKVDLTDRFTYHAPTAKGVAVHGELSAMFTELAAFIVTKVPPGREQSLALTKLEEGKFWASAGVARNPQTR